MFLHQFRDDLVLALELVAQRGDGPLEVALRRGILALEGGRSVLEELLLPEVEQGGGELMLVAEIRDGHVVDQMAPEDGDLLDRRIVLPRLPQGRNSFRVLLELGHGVSPFPAEARHLDRDGGSYYDPTRRAFLCEVDETGLRRLLPEDMLAGDGVHGSPRHRFARPTTVAWTLLADGDAESIGSEVAAGHHNAACGLLLNRAIELLSLAAALPETTLPA